MRTCVVIPTYNEVENVDDVISRVIAHENIDVLVVDDSSPDGTATKVQKWVDSSEGRVSLLSRAEKNGLGAAYLFGFAHCIEKKYDIICEMDADLSHDPAALPTLIAPIVSGDADLVLGSRYVPGGRIPQWSLRRRMLSRGGNIFARFMLGLKVHDATGGFRAYRREVLTDIMTNDIRAGGYGFQIEMTYLASKYNALIMEVPISFSDRIKGTSKMNFSIVLEALILVFWWSIRDRVFQRRKSKRSRHKSYEMADTSHGKKSSDHDKNLS